MNLYAGMGWDTVNNRDPTGRAMPGARAFGIGVGFGMSAENARHIANAEMAYTRRQCEFCGNDTVEGIALGQGLKKIGEVLADPSMEDGVAIVPLITAILAKALSRRRGRKSSPGDVSLAPGGAEVGRLGLAKKKGGPTFGPDSTLDKLSPGEIVRIQNAANRKNIDIAVVGSRVNQSKKLHPRSDYDFVVEANHDTRTNVARSLPGAKSVQENVEWNQDVLKGPLKREKPHVVFHPEKSDD